MSFSKQWHALGREAELAGEQIASGVTALSRANHAQKGLYTQAFFGLSIGIERIAKLIIVADHAVVNSGAFPDNAFLRQIGHDISALLDYCEPISQKIPIQKQHSARPSDPIHQGIVQTLTEFGKLSRYYNLDFLAGGRAAQLPEPIAAWWQRVGEPILSKHYSAKQKARDAAQSTAMAALMNSISTVIHHIEQGDLIDNVEELMLRGSATQVVQTYGRLYTLQIIRWLAFLISDLSRIGAYEKRIEPLLGLDEPFELFRGDDAFFRSRTKWSIYRR